MSSVSKAPVVACAGILLLLQLLSALCCSALPGTCELQEDRLVDKATGIAFESAHALSNAAPYALLGAGPRKKNLFVVEVNVYSVGLYVDPAQAGKALGAFKGKAADALANDEGFYKALASSSLDKALHLVFARSVPAGKVVDALTALEGVDKAVLESFSKSLLQAIGGSIGKGESVTLAQVGGDKLQVKVRGKPVGSFASAELPQALFGLYIGSKPISAEAKAGFAALAPKVLA